MQQDLLNDAAIVLSRILTLHRIHHGFFGGFAILASGARHRQPKDLDVLISAPKRTITTLLSTHHGWLEIPQAREDYVAYFWDSGAQQAMVLVEMFLGDIDTRFPVATKNHVLAGTTMGTSYVPVLGEEYLLRGKISAAATRARPEDLQDIQFLVNLYGERLAQVARRVDAKTLGMAMKRHPPLKKILEKAGVHTRAGWGVRRAKVEIDVQPGMWEVQKKLFSPTALISAPLMLDNARY